MIDYEKIKEAFKVLNELKSQVFYSYNDSCTNPVLAKVGSVSTDGSEIRLYVTSGTSYDGYRNMSLEELEKNWSTDLKEYLWKRSKARKEYLAKCEDFIREVYDQEKEHEILQRFLDKFKEREEYIKNK